jgi:membrane protease YdiL (CAAX protease family)
MTATERDEPSWGPGVAIIGVAVGFGFAFTTSLVIDIIALAAGANSRHLPTGVTLLLSLAVDVSFVASAAVVVARAGPLRPRQFGYRRPRVVVAIVSMVIAAIVYYGLSALYANLLGLHSERLPKELGFGGGTADLIGAGIFVCVIAPVCEEFFFRGFVFGALLRLPLGRLTIAAASLITGVLFGAAHIGSAPAQYLVPLGLFGVVLCLVRWRTGSLYPCMALHSINNALALGVNALNWSAGQVVALALASLCVIAGLTVPLASLRGSRPMQDDAQP